MESRSRFAPKLVLTLAIVAAAVSAAELAWVCDDSFISFRYAKNLADGVGLVFNAGEVVEGYSNFLWTLMTAAAIRLGGDPVTFSENAGMVFFVALLALLAQISLRVFNRGGALPAASFACLLYALMRDTRIWATGGLETTMYTFFVLAGYACFLKRRRWGWALASSLALNVALLIRIDAGAFVAVLGLYLAWRKWRYGETAQFWAFALPLVFLFGPYFAWRYARYGYLMPNPYYAKSAFLSYWSRGLEFLSLYLIVTGVWTLFPLAAFVRGRLRLRPREREAFWLAAALAGLYTFLVTRVGGGHMCSRLLIPVTPFYCLLLERLVLAIEPQPKRWLVCAGLACAAYFAPDIPQGRQRWCGITNERNFYPREWLEASKWRGRWLRRALNVPGASMVTGGCQCATAYYSELPVIIEETGLTDPHIAHGPIYGPRGVVGHEKFAEMPYLVITRGIHLSLCHPAEEYNLMRVGPYRVTILFYDEQFLNRLRGRPHVKFVDFNEYLREYFRGIQRKPIGQVAKDYIAFRMYYFYHHPDSPWLAAFDAYFRSQGVLRVTADLKGVELLRARPARPARTR